jgi:hypothetical protein
MADESSDQANDALPPPHPELERLEQLIGSWKAEDHTNDSMLGPGVPVTNAEKFTWLDGSYFLVSTYETVFGNDPAQRGLNYWGYDAKAKRLRIILFSNNGPFTEKGNRYEGKVAGGKLHAATASPGDRPGQNGRNWLWNHSARSRIIRAEPTRHVGAEATGAKQWRPTP